MNNVTMNHVHITFDAMGKQQVFHILGVCLHSCPSYLVWKSQVSNFMKIMWMDSQTNRTNLIL